MPDNSAETTAARGTTSVEDVRAIISRVLSLAIFFTGVGLFAAIGLAMHQTALFGDYEVTYFAVGVAVGVVGILLWLVSR